MHFHRRLAGYPGALVVIVAFAAGVHVAWVWQCGDGIGFLFAEQSREDVLRHVFARRSHLLFTVTHEGLLAVPKRSWHTAADHPGADGIHGGVPPKTDGGIGLRLRFAEPIQGPLMLGYASHYGSGLFRDCVAEPLIITRSEQGNSGR